MAENEIKEAFASCCEDHGTIDSFRQAPVLVDVASRQLKVHGTDKLETIIGYAKQVYDGWIAPFDIPVIPNPIEPQVDAAIWEAIELAIRAVASRMS